MVTKQTWVSIYGRASVAGGVITHIPVLRDVADTPSADVAGAQIPHSILRSNMDFDQGVISWEARLGDPESRVQLLLPAESLSAGSPIDIGRSDSVNAELSVGFNVLGAPYGFAFWNGSWEGIGGSGHGSELSHDVWIQLQLIAQGSQIDFYVNGVKVLSTNRSLRRGQIGLLFQSNSRCSVRNVQVKTDIPTCFVIMQFTEEYNTLYKEVIRPVCEAHGYKVVRGDDFYTNGQILEDVTNTIRSASLIIADVTPDNANVFYEVGFAHAINKPTILLSEKKRGRLPFDISGFRTLFYDNTISGKSAIEGRLRLHLEALRPS